MQKHSVAWGLDIGHSSIKASKIARVGDKAVVQGYAIEPITVEEGGDRDAALVHAMQQLATREEFGATPVLMAISGRQVYSKTVNIPVLNPKKMQQMVELEARQQIPGDFNEIEWGYHASPNADGASVDCTLFAVKREVTQELIAKSKKAGINLVGVSVSNLALYNFVQFDQVFPADEAVVILDIGAENTDLVIYQGEMVWMSAIGVSGNDITKAFAKKFRVSEAEAETLKRQAADSRQADRIIKVIEGTLGELTSEVNRRLGAYRAANKEAKLENLVISGNTFRLAGLPEYMAEKLRFTVNILEDLDKIQVDPGFERDHFMHDLGALGVSLGLGLQACGFAKANVNLMPTGLQIEKQLNSKRWAGVAAVLLIGGTVYADYAMVDGLLTQNTQIEQKSKVAYETNNARMKDSLELLKAVAPEVQGLVRFDHYGDQTGVVQGVLAGVVQVVEQVVKENGKSLADSSKPVESGGNPALQAAWLRSVDVPSANPSAGGPFAPFAEKRTVTVVVHIPRGSRQADIRKAIEEGLRNAPVPDHLKDVHGGARLFAEVQSPTEVVVRDIHHYIDKQHIDEKTGNLAPIDQVREVAVNAVTFSCTLTGAKEATK